MSPGSDVLIIGAGVVGAATAYYCARAGLSVHVLDQGRPGGGSSSRCEGNILVSDKDHGPELQLAAYSLGLWNGELYEHASAWEFERKGGIIVASQPSSLLSLQRALAVQREHGIRVEEMDVDSLREREPHVTHRAVGAAYYPDDAQVMPMMVVNRLLALARGLGARVTAGTEVTSLLREGDRVVGARTPSETWRADAVINATGPWAESLGQMAGVHLPVGPRRGYVMVTEPLPPRVFHKVYAAEYIDNVAASETSLQASPVIESTPAGSVLIGSSRERVGFSDAVNRAALRTMAHNAIELFPFLRDVRVIRHYHGFRPYSEDHTPVIGPDSRAPGLWHATGHEGAGIGCSVGTGKLIAHAMTGLETDIPLSPFDPARFGELRPGTREREAA